MTRRAGRNGGVLGKGPGAGRESQLGKLLLLALGGGGSAGRKEEAPWWVESGESLRGGPGCEAGWRAPGVARRPLPRVQLGARPTTTAAITVTPTVALLLCVRYWAWHFTSVII